MAGLAGLAALLLALGIGAFRLFIDLLPGYQQRIVERVREETGLILEFDDVHARIGRYGPEVVFEGARVLPASGGEPLVSAAAGRVSLAIARSIRYRRLGPGHGAHSREVLAEIGYDTERIAALVAAGVVRA